VTLLIVFETDLSFADSFINSLKSRDAMAAKIVRAMSQMFAGFAKVSQSRANLRMRCIGCGSRGGSFGLRGARRRRHSYGITESENQNGGSQ